MKWNKTDKELPDRDPNKRRSTVPCLVIRNNQIRILVFNHEDHCWDEESGDDYECDVMQVSHWIALSSLPKPDESPSSDPAEVLVKALEKILTPGYTQQQLQWAAKDALSQYEQLKQPNE